MDAKWMRLPKPIPLEGIDPPAEQLKPSRFIDVHGREEHEAILIDSEKCEELGLDQGYEVMKYLRRWGGWLGGS